LFSLTCQKKKKRSGEVEVDLQEGTEDERGRRVRESELGLGEEG
jgi:hypothetical protein